MKRVHVAGVGLWTPGFGSARAWVDKRHDPAEVRPACAMLRTRIGRYASLVARMAIAAMEQAGEHADLANIPTVFGSAYGEIRIAFEQLDMIEHEGRPSPARFKNSVHNAASGHFSIGTGNMTFSTALAAGGATFAMSLLEAWAWLETHGGAILVAVTDESLPDHLSTVASYDPLGLALLLDSKPPKSGSLGSLSDLRSRTGLAMRAEVPERLVANPCAAGLPLIEALMHGIDATVPLELGDGGWSVELQCGAGQSS